MRVGVWVSVGFVAMSLLGGLGAAWPTVRGMPSASDILTVFAAVRMGPGGAAAVALGLGYGVGRAAGAPPGLVELGHLGLGALVFALSGRLRPGQRLFFGFICAAGCLVVQGLVVLAWAIGWSALRPLWPSGTTAQVLGTGILAALVWRPLLRLDRRLAGHTVEALGWR